MPIEYGFEDPLTEKDVNLQDVDNELRVALGLPIDNTKFCVEFEALVWFGIAACFSGKFDIKKIPLPTRPINAEVERLNDICLGFIIRRYRFWCTR